MGDPCISSYTIQFLFLGNAKKHLPWGFLGLPARVRDPPASPLRYLLASRPPWVTCTAVETMPWGLADGFSPRPPSSLSH